MQIQQEELGQFLKMYSGLDIEIKINSNKKTLVNVLQRENNYIKVSLHKMFLQAPEHILKELSGFISGTSSCVPKTLKVYMNDQFHSQMVKPFQINPMKAKGQVHDLELYFNEINSSYFDNQLDLNIYWYGSSQRTAKTKLVLGLFDPASRSIKINKVLDSEDVPDYFCKFVIYHEVLHYLYPPIVDNKNVLRVHHDIFKKNEKKFKDFSKAISWEKQHRGLLFGLTTSES